MYKFHIRQKRISLLVVKVYPISERRYRVDVDCGSDVSENFNVSNSHDLEYGHNKNRRNVGDAVHMRTVLETKNKTNIIIELS